MFKIKIKTLISILISKSLYTASNLLFKGGTNFPGRVALKIDRHVLKQVSKDYSVILITGTNGKTTTTSMLFNIIKDSGVYVTTNKTGANMLPGIVASLISSYEFFNKSKKRVAVIEVDEANLKYITEYITPKYIAITNLFRDQLDRYGEVYSTLNVIIEGIQKVPSSTLILNGDESLLGSLSLPNEKIYYGFDTEINKNKTIDLNADAKFCKNCKSPYNYDFITYNHLGKFYCKTCGYSRPDLHYKVEQMLEITESDSKVVINNEAYEISQPGTYNIYNALCALSIAKDMGIDYKIINNSLTHQDSSFGRQENLRIEGKSVKIILVKNPAGYDEAINTVSFNKNPISLAFLLNDNYADGKDVSWIWDVNFEKLKELSISNVFISGLRLYDMAIRLKIAGLDSSNFNLSDSNEKLLNDIKNSNENEVYILATYTAMLSLRKYLYSKKYIKKLW